MSDSNKLELPCGKPLLIYGNPGSGKTHLALELLKDTILLRIDVSQIKEIKEIKDMKHYLLDKLKRRNVTLMFKDKNDQRGLLIDDISYLSKI
jgi:chromosomal replication initiation ATPase DnaA